MRKLLIVVVLVAVVAAGVFLWRRGTPPGDVAGAGDADSPLAFVPADTPYVFANLEPIPRAVSERWMTQMNLAASLWQVQITQAIRKIETDRPDAEELKWLRAANAELEGKSVAQVFEALGYDLQAKFAFYGIGLAPVMRLTLADPDKFRAFVARIEERGGQALPRAKLGDLEYWNFTSPEAKVRGVVALQGNQLVLTFAPPNDDAALRILLGVERPAQDMRNGAALIALNKQFGYLPSASGYLDTKRVVAQFTAAPTALETAFLTAFGIEKPATDAVCAGEYAALASAMPRLSLGYTQLDAQRMDVVARLETSPAIAKDLMELRAPMPGLAQVKDAPLNFGLSLRIGALPNVVGKWASAVAAAPWKCPALAELNAGFAQSRDQLMNPAVFAAAPVFHGFHAIATRIDMKNSMAGTPDFGGKLLIGSPDPNALIGMAKSFVPQLATMTLKPDGKVQPLPALPNVPADLPTFVAMTPGVLGLAFGQGEDADLGEYLTSDPTQQPLLVLGYSGALFADFTQSMLEQAAKEQDPAQRAEQEQAAKMMAQIYAHIRRADIRVEFSESGIEMHQSAELN